MTCDDAFDAMTADAEFSAELRFHLANCPRCRQMHETLSPALNALDDVLDHRPAAPWLSASQPSQDAVALARTVAADLTRSAVITRRWQRLATGLRYTAALFVAFALGLAFIPLSRPSPGRDAAVPAPPGSCTRTLVQSSTDARALVKTCMACHIRPEASKAPRSSLFSPELPAGQTDRALRTCSLPLPLHKLLRPLPANSRNLVFRDRVLKRALLVVGVREIPFASLDSTSLLPPGDDLSHAGLLIDGPLRGRCSATLA
jgi:hypothetical protein